MLSNRLMPIDVRFALGETLWHTSEIWQWVSVVPAAVGGFFVGYHIFDDNRTSNTNLWIGIGSLAVAGISGAHSEKLLSEAVDRHNQKLVSTKKSANEFTFHPLLASQPGTTAPGAGIGFSLRLYKGRAPFTTGLVSPHAQAVRPAKLGKPWPASPKLLLPQCMAGRLREDMKALLA
jgi:hypothetical protein